MGHYADSAVAHFMNGLGRGKRSRRRGFQSKSGDYKWRLSSGRVVRMDQMTDEHLANAMRLAETKHPDKARQMRETLETRA